MAACTREIGLTIKGMEMGALRAQMELYIEEVGRMINRMGEEQRPGHLELSMMVNIRMVSNMEKGTLDGQIILCITANFTSATFKDMGNIYGVMDEPTKACGILIKCTARELKNGQMARCIRVNTYTTRKTVMVYLHGQMENPMMVSGKIIANTVRDTI